MQRGTFSILAFGVTLLIAWALPAQEQRSGEELVQRIASLAEKADPRRDDWQMEAWQSTAAEQLARLATILVEGRWGELPAVLVEPGRCRPLRPPGRERRRLAGGLELSRLVEPLAATAGFGPCKDALKQLAASMPSVSAPRIRFKIVGVSSSGDSSSMTRVRYEAAAHVAGGNLQQVATWSIRWIDDEESAAPRIVEIAVESYEELLGPGPLFVDRTTAVLPDDPALTRQLARGGEHWYGRIDALGEPNLMGHQGIAVGDVNGDGLEDLYVAMGTGLPNKLLVQQPDGSVLDTAVAAQVAWLDDTKGVLFADMDNDGDQDLLTAIGPTIVLAKNDGKGAFERFVSLRAPTPASFYSLSVADFDLDGDLDIYGTRYVKLSYGVSVPLPFHDANNGPTNHLLRNDGEDRFVDVTVQVGLNRNNSRFSLVGVWEDYDDDGDSDLYVANDFGRNNLYRNTDGKFEDVAALAGVEDQAAGMGVSWTDYDLDGDVDLHVTNMFSAAGNRVAYQPRFKRGAATETRGEIQRYSLGNTLLANQGDGTFRDVSDHAGVRMGRWGWGGRFVDLNNDGFDDLVVPNGFLTGALPDDL